MNKILAAVLLALFAASPSYAVAQEAMPDLGSAYDTTDLATRPLYAPDPLEQPQQLTSCFDTYRFGSVFVTLGSALPAASQGSVLAFEGTITNENPYPVPNATAWAKVFRVRSQDQEKDVNGPDVLAWVPIAERLDLEAGEVRPLSFEWEVPPDAEPGTYQLATYVTTFDRFELSGLSFTDDVAGTKVEFQVAGEPAGAVRFDKDSVLVNGEPFYFAAFPSIIPPMTPDVPVQVTVMNTTDTPFDGTVDWKLYYWDRLSARTLLKETTEELKIHPNSSTTLSYVVSDTDHTAYYLIGELRTELGAQSIIGVRFGRADVAEPRFNFVTGTPATETAENGKAVACIHSTGPLPVMDGRVELTARRGGFFGELLSLLGMGTLAHATYEGPIPSAVYALEASLSEAADSYIVNARLYQGDRLIDEVSVPYCAEGGCASSAAMPLAIMIAAFLLIGLVTAILIRRRARSLTPQTPAV